MKTVKNIISVPLKSARRDDMLVSIYDKSIHSGDNNCYCPDSNCNAQLVVKKKEHERTAHFSHKPGTPACYGVETALHLKAKEILQKLDCLEMPKYTLSKDYLYNFFNDDISLIEKKFGIEIFKNTLSNQFEYQTFSCYFNKVNGRFSLDDFPIIKAKKIDLKKYIVQSEKSKGSIIPDITLTNKKTFEKFYVEVGVTHLIDNEKRKKIIENDLTVLEIDFSEYYKKYETPELDIENYFIDPHNFKKKP